jgi:hypothetical protein
MAEDRSETPAEPVSNPLWELDQIIIALRQFRERLRRVLAGE